MFKPRFRTTEKHCSYKCATACAKSKPSKPKTFTNLKRTPVRKVSKKRAKENPIYTKKRKAFLSRPENKICKINGSDCTIKATTIEHTRGRKGFADDKKRAEGISLYLDEDYWLPACNNCNCELENNSELSKKHQLSKIHGGKKI